MSPKLCARCEEPIILGGYLLLPGVADINHYCFKCCIDEVKEYNRAQGIETHRVLLVRPDEDEGGNDFVDRPKN